MSKTKNSSTKAALNRGPFPVIVLIVACTICTLLLALINGITAEAREQQRMLKITQNRQLLFPEGKEFSELDVADLQPEVGNLTALAQVTDQSGQELGYIAESNSPGYGGLVNVMVGIDTEGKIVGVRILDNSETAGLGKKVENDSFRNQFNDLSATDRYSARNNPEYKKIDAVSGATISSEAVSQSINIACDAWQAVAGGTR